MDIEETAAAYRRAMDAGTARDMIEDLQLDREELLTRIRQLEARLRELEAERNYWQRCFVNNG